MNILIFSNRKPLLVSLILTISLACPLFSQEDPAIDQAHPLFGRMEAFYVKKHSYVRYVESEYDTPDGKVTVGGKQYYYDYRLNGDAEAPGRDAVIGNYENAVKQLGGELMASSDQSGKTFRSYKLNHKGTEIWVYVGIAAYNVEGEHGLYVLEKSPMPQEIVANPDYVPGSIPEPDYEIVPDRQGQDHPLFNNRLRGSWIFSSNTADFEKHTLQVSKEESYEVEGKKYDIAYRMMPGATYPGIYGILKNYQNAIEQIGGKTLLLSVEDHPTKGIFKLLQGSTAIWVEIGVDNVNKRWRMIVVESQAMEQQITANAEYMAENIKNTGRVAVYGILFDTGKSVIKTGSEEPIAEIAKLLERDKNLDLYIVGHTDMEGELAANIKLAEDRAQAVAQWLVDKHKIKEKRLTPKGVGPLSPVASNDNEAGKRLNRRVELVKK